MGIADLRQRAKTYEQNVDEGPAESVAEFQEQERSLRAQVPTIAADTYRYETRARILLERSREEMAQRAREALEAAARVTRQAMERERAVIEYIAAQSQRQAAHERLFEEEAAAFRQCADAHKQKLEAEAAEVARRRVEAEGQFKQRTVECAVALNHMAGAVLMLSSIAMPCVLLSTCSIMRSTSLVCK